MAEYIEREAAISAAEHAYNEWNLAMAAADGKREINLVFKRQELCKAVASVFTGAPVADVAPVVHGHWKKDRDTIKCTVCGFGMFPNRYTFMNGVCVTDNKLPKYCENCGAKMGGEIDGET